MKEYPFTLYFRITDMPKRVSLVAQSYLRPDCLLRLYANKNRAFILIQEDYLVNMPGTVKEIENLMKVKATGWRIPLSQQSAMKTATLPPTTDDSLSLNNEGARRALIYRHGTYLGLLEVTLDYSTDHEKKNQA